jgi:hypothetical protein
LRFSPAWATQFSPFITVTHTILLCILIVAYSAFACLIEIPKRAHDPASKFHAVKVQRFESGRRSNSVHHPSDVPQLPPHRGIRNERWRAEVFLQVGPARSKCSLDHRRLEGGWHHPHRATRPCFEGLVRLDAHA